MQAVSQVRIKNIEPVAMTPCYRHNNTIIKRGDRYGLQQNIEKTKTTFRKTMDLVVIIWINVIIIYIVPF